MLAPQRDVKWHLCDAVRVDLTDELSRLETLGPALGAHETAVDGPGTPLEALRLWVAARGIRRGLTPSPPPTAMLRVFSAYAAARGWDETPPSAHLVGTALARAGLTHTGDRRFGYYMDRASAAALWRDVGESPRPRRKDRGGRANRSERNARRLTSHPSKPLRTCDGRMWRSQGVLADALGVTGLAVSRAVHKACTVKGLHVRFATPDEVRAWRGEEWDGGIGSPS